MVKTWIVTTFILLYFLPLLTLGNEIDTTYYKSRASDLIRKGADLSREGRDVEALDSLKIALEIRKMIYGSEHYMLRSPYSVSGVAYKNLGQNIECICSSHH